MHRLLAMLVALLPLALLAPTAVRAQEATPSAPPSEVQQLAEDTYAFVSGGYVSLFIVTDEGVIATDPGGLVDSSRPAAYKDAIASVTDQPVRYVVYSHSHADHATGGGVFADTATFVSHLNAVDDIAGLNDPNTPTPTIAFTDRMAITLGGKTIDLYYTGRNHSDNMIVVHDPEQRVLFAVDFIPVNSLPFQDLPDAYPEEWVASLQWVEDNLDFDTLVPGHPPVPGTKETVTRVQTYLEDLMASVRAAQEQGLADNSPEMLEAVRADLAPNYESWANFEEWLPLNIEGLTRIWSSAAAPSEATPAA
jgi:glyoxylase-like metal-dependent hydrolase (beta-lactamase superfamily II)